MRHFHSLLFVFLSTQGCVQSVDFVTDAGTGSSDGGTPDVRSLADAVSSDAGPADSMDAPLPSNCPCEGVCWRNAPDYIEDIGADSEGRVFLVRDGRVFSLEGSEEISVEMPPGSEGAEYLELLGQRRIYLHVRHEGRSDLYVYGTGAWSPLILPTPPSAASTPLLAEMGDRLFFAWDEGDVLYELDEGRADEVRSFRSEGLRIQFLSASAQLLAATFDDDVEGNHYIIETLSIDGSWTPISPLDPQSGFLRDQYAHVAGGLVVRSGHVWDGMRDVAIPATTGAIDAGEYEGAPIVYAGGAVIDLTDLSNPIEYPIRASGDAGFTFADGHVVIAEGQQVWAADRVAWRFSGLGWEAQTTVAPGFRAGAAHVAGTTDDFWVGGATSLRDVIFTRFRGNRVDEQMVHLGDFNTYSSPLNFEPQGDSLFVGTRDHLIRHAANRTSVVESDEDQSGFFLASGLGRTFAVGGNAIWTLDSSGPTMHRSLEPARQLLVDGGVLSPSDEQVRVAMLSVFEGTNGSPGFWIVPNYYVVRAPLMRFDGESWSLVEIPLEAYGARDATQFTGTADEAIFVVNDTVFEWNGTWTSTRLELPENEPTDPFGGDETRVLVSDGSRFTILNFNLVRWTRESRGNWSLDRSCEGAQPFFHHAWWPDDAPGPMYFGYDSSILETSAVQ